jgi:hypothetical protein
MATSNTVEIASWQVSSIDGNSLSLPRRSTLIERATSQAASALDLIEVILGLLTHNIMTDGRPGVFLPTWLCFAGRSGLNGEFLNFPFLPDGDSNVLVLHVFHFKRGHEKDVSQLHGLSPNSTVNCGSGNFQVAGGWH